MNVAPPKKERKLKIHPKHFPRSGRPAVFPEIRLEGKWLQDLGFVCGRHVSIVVQENNLVITLLPEAKPQPIPETKRRKRSSIISRQSLCTHNNSNCNRQPLSEPAGYKIVSDKPFNQAAES